MLMLKTKIYKPCSKNCNKCPSFKAFARVVREIDITKVSKHERDEYDLSKIICWYRCADCDDRWKVCID
jgi:hypothetical protein